MKINILAIAPYPGLVNLIKELATGFPQFNMIVVQGDMEEALPYLNKYTNEDIDFIISRGGTAKLIEKHTAIPVIEVQVTGYDILRILTLLKGQQSQIQMIGFSNIIHNFEAVSNLINMDINYTVISHENEVEEALVQAKQDGSQVIVGDTITIRLAKNIGLPGVLITSGRESVLEAFQIILKMNRYMNKLEVKNKKFIDVFNKMDEGIGVIDKEGQIIHANQAFLDLFQLVGGEENQSSLFEAYPYFRRLISLNTNDREYSIEINLFGKKYVVSSSRLHQDDSSKEIFFIKFAKTEFDQHGFFIRYPQEIIGKFPQLIVSGRIFHEAIEKANLQIAAQRPVCIYGEIGTGKRLFVSLLHRTNNYQDGSLIEVVVKKQAAVSLDILMKKLIGEDETTLIHIIGFDNLSPNQQNLLIEKMKEIRAQLIFSFASGWDDQMSRVNPHLKENIIFLPPLRERLSEFEEFIRAFIFQFNEIYGKQVVGVQPEVMKQLKEYEWRGNLFELRGTIKELVRTSIGEYIDRTIVLEQYERDETGTKQSECNEINLNQTLEMIEKQIIQRILDEENMNQSKAAKRLGINRSTLWRKLKT